MHDGVGTEGALWHAAAMTSQNTAAPSLAHITDWVFDLDNTLYPRECNLFAQIDLLISDYMVGVTQLPYDEARALQKTYYREYGTTLNGLMQRHAVDPDHFLNTVCYEVGVRQLISERMLTNGFFARSIIIDGTERGEGQEPEDCSPTPRILETAQYWANFNPGKGNLQKFYPTPKIVPYTDDAKALLIDARKACEVEYKLAERAGDPVGTTVWGRTSEHIRKLALIYSIAHTRGHRGRRHPN